MTACALLATLALLWIAGEQHYQSCVARVTAEAVPITTTVASGQPGNPLKTVTQYPGLRRDEINACSRLPWGWTP